MNAAQGLDMLSLVMGSPKRPSIPTAGSGRKSLVKPEVVQHEKVHDDLKAIDEDGTQDEFMSNPIPAPARRSTIDRKITNQ